MGLTDRMCIRAGHNKRAVGARHKHVGYIVKEEEETVKVKEELIKYLKNSGCCRFLLDATPVNLDKNADLKYGVATANANDAVLVSIHFNNCYKTTQDVGMGSEVLMYDVTNANRGIGLQILKNLESLGFKNRGLKERKDLYETRATVKQCFIIEVCFLESIVDMGIYRNKDLGAKMVARAIALGLQGKSMKENIVNFVVGDVVRVKKEAKRWVTGQDIPSWVCNSAYIVNKTDGAKVLLSRVNSWVHVQDIYKV